MYFMTRPFVIPQFTTHVCQAKRKKNPFSLCYVPVDTYTPLKNFLQNYFKFVSVLQ